MPAENRQERETLRGTVTATMAVAVAVAVWGGGEEATGTLGLWLSCSVASFATLGGSVIVFCCAADRVGQSLQDRLDGLLARPSTSY